MQAALTIDSIGVDFAGLRAVDGVSMIIDEGELRVLLGANGAGKTTLMDLISGRTKCTDGRVFLYDNDITNWEEHAIARQGARTQVSDPQRLQGTDGPAQSGGGELPQSRCLRQSGVRVFQRFAGTG